VSSNGDIPGELELYRTLAENAGDLICQAGTTARYTYVSPNYEQVLGYTREDLIGHSIFRLVHPDDVAQVHRRFVQSVLAHRPARVQFRYRHKNGSWRWLETSGKPFFGWKGHWTATFISRDVTERRQEEEARRVELETSQSRLRVAQDSLRELQPVAEELLVQCHALGESLADRLKAEDLLLHHAETLKKMRDIVAEGRGHENT
jgi:PAS domain S-box-containing protein